MAICIGLQGWRWIFRLRRAARELRGTSPASAPIGEPNPVRARSNPRLMVDTPVTRAGERLSTTIRARGGIPTNSLHGSDPSRVSFSEVSGTASYRCSPLVTSTFPYPAHRLSREPGCNGLGFLRVLDTRCGFSHEPSRYLGYTVAINMLPPTAGEEASNGANRRARRGTLRGLGGGVR